MDYGNYLVDSDSVMDLEDVKNYIKKDMAYILFIDVERKNTLRLERVAITHIQTEQNPFDETDHKVVVGYYLFDNDTRHEIPWAFVGERYVFLKTKPGEQYVKVSAEFLVPKGEWCEECKYCSHKKVFFDECGHCHNGSCFFHMTYLDFDRGVAKMEKCEACKRTTL